MSSVGRERCLLLKETNVFCWKRRMSSVGIDNVFFGKRRMPSSGTEECFLLIQNVGFCNILLEVSRGGSISSENRSRTLRADLWSHFRGHKLTVFGPGGGTAGCHAKDLDDHPNSTATCLLMCFPGRCAPSAFGGT